MDYVRQHEGHDDGDDDGMDVSCPMIMTVKLQ